MNAKNRGPFAGGLRLGIASFTSGAPGASIPLGDRMLGAALARAGHTAEQVIWSASDVRWERFDGIVVRSCWDYHLHPEAFLGWLAKVERAGVPLVNSVSLIRWNFNKRYLAEIASTGLAIPETLWLDESQRCEVAAVCDERGWKAAVVKPLISASAHRTELRRDGIATGPAMVQEFIEEIQTEGEWSLIFLGAEFSHAVRKKPASGDFRVQEEFGGVTISATPPQAVVDFGARALARLPEIAALARVDLVVAKQRGPILMELEVIEPELFLPDHGPAADHAAAAVVQYLAAFETVEKPI